MSVRRLLPALLLGAGAWSCATRAPDPAVAPFEPDSVPDAYVAAGGALIWPGTTRAFLVDAGGDVYDGERRLVLEPSADSVPAGPPARIAAPDRWRPLLRWVRHSGGVRWEFEAVAFPHPAPRESVLVASIVARARNEGAEPHAYALRATMRGFGDGDPFVAWDGRDAADAASRAFAAGGPGPARAWCADAAHAETLEVAGTLAPGAQREVRLLLAAYEVAGTSLEQLARVPHRDRVAAAEAYWRDRLALGTAFALGDSGVTNALRAARMVLLSCRESRGARWVPTGGPFHYRDVWLRDGARLAHALAVSGHGSEALDAVEGLAELQWPNGAYLSQRGQLDGTGQALWAFEQVLLRGSRAGAPDAYLEAGLRAWRWIERQREAGRAISGPLGAVLPFAEPRDNELVRAQLVGNDAWAIAGERALARMLRVRGRRAEADSVAASAEQYARTFRVKLDALGTAGVPASWQRTGRDWGNLAVGWPCGVLPPGEPRLEATARSAWAAADGAGLVTYGSRDSLHYYVGADLGTWALLAGRREQADSVLAALLEWRTASGTAGEVFRADGRTGRNLPPHPTSAAALVALVRNALLLDEPDTLRLTLGAREAWWAGARVTGAPTWWGPLDLAFERRGREAVWRWTAVPVWTSLTLPPGTRAALPLRAPLVAGPREDVVLAPPRTREARVVLASRAP